jgi:phage terminase large subunit-like protein
VSELFRRVDVERARPGAPAVLPDDIPPAEAYIAQRPILMLDPGGNAKQDFGIIVAARQGPRVLILADRTTSGDPNIWSKAVVATAYEFDVREVYSTHNPGFEFVGSILKAAGLRYIFKQRLAPRRHDVEAVAALYERGAVCHPQPLEDLEAQLIRYGGREHLPRAAAAIAAIRELHVPASPIYFGGGAGGGKTARFNRETSPPADARK